MERGELVQSLIYLGPMRNIMFVRLKTNPECVKKSVKGERRSVLIYGFKFSAAGVGLLIKLHGRVNANVYQNLLQQHAVSSLQTSLKQPTMFMQDNVPITLQKR